MRTNTAANCLLTSLFLFAAPLRGEETIPSGAKLFIAPMDGYETYVKAAISKKKVPVIVVEDRSQADYELTGTSQSQKAGAAKKIIMLDWRSSEEASVGIMNIKTGEVIFAYSVNKKSSARGKQSSAEACAKHIKKKVK